MGCLGCGMWDVGCLLGYGILVYKMLFIPGDIRKSFEDRQAVRQESLMMLQRLLTRLVPYIYVESK